MKMKLISIAVIAVFTFSLFGCVSEEHKGAATGAVVGGAVGATAGALMGHKGAKTETAIIGGLLGALVGGVIGHYAYDVKRSRQETARKYDYDSSMGAVVRIEEVSVVPKSVWPGDKVDMRATYALLDTSPSAEIDVTEIREIRRNGELVGKPEVNVTRGGGTYASTVPLVLPDDARKGTYTVITTVRTPKASDTLETTFTVR